MRLRVFAIFLLMSLWVVGGCRKTEERQNTTKRRSDPVSKSATQVDTSTRSGPRHIYSSIDEPIFKFSHSVSDVLSDAEDITTNCDGTYRFGLCTLKDNNIALVVVADDKAVQITSDYGWRPISAKWINAKLLFIEQYFNPHYGHYCIYDVERDKVILSELENDGTDAWRRTDSKK